MNWPLIINRYVLLLAATTFAAPMLAAATGPALSIDAGAGQRAINPDIYGVNQLSDEALATELRLPVRRWGGNTTSRYNWQIDTYNTGLDWYFENIPLTNTNVAALPNGSSTDRFVEQNQRTGSRTLMTVPTLGWVAKRRTDGHPFDCGFKVSRYGAQQSTDYWDPDCGNGLTPSGSNITNNNPTDTSVVSNPAFITAWVQHLVGSYGTAANGGVSYYAFDNEPMLWHSTHRDVHPQLGTYDEMRNHAWAYGAAIKAVDPSAKTLGPVEDGWCRYLYSAADDCGPGADYAAHGSVQYVPWYLQQMKSYEQQHGLRVLDYLDLHNYPAASGVALSPAGNATTQALRLRSTRSLWDASYIDESWISHTAPGGVAVRLIPRMKQWVADHYPGTRLAISEYNWGAPESINGALAQADVLGIFGREGLDLATLWGEVLPTQPLAYAFRLYRNYDGAGHGFGDTSVQAISADQGVLAIYAARRSADGALTLMVLNKSGADLTSGVSLAGFNPQASARVFRYSPANLGAIEPRAAQAVSASGFGASFAANSISLFELLPQAPTVLLNTTSLAFGNQAARSGSAPRAVTLTNSGGAPLSLAISAPATSAFVLTHDCPASLAAGAGCSLSVRFTPKIAGPASDAIVLTTNAAGSPHQMTLTGQGQLSTVKRVDLTPILMLLLD
ncbi:MAG: choice-of-anchor D domain-containing protein [Comamonadaceae bacterium]|nr:choice-of-anchor D domain-containing protein [Comamonadaceae bacterium]